MKKYLIIYHGEDNDGVFSGAIFYDYLINHKQINSKQIVYLGTNYNELKDFENHNSIDDLKDMYDVIIMTDISFSGGYMKKVYEAYGNNFIWCDHHAPIINESNIISNKFGQCLGIRNTSKSAILCAYEYLYDPFNEKYSQINKKPSSDFPEILRILSGWDSWSYEREGYTNEYVRNINKGVTFTFNLDFNKVVEFVNKIISIYNFEDISYNKNDIEYTFIEDMYKFGKQLNDYDDICNENIIKTSGDFSWQIRLDDKDKGRPLFLNACAIFTQGPSNSLMFKSIKNRKASQGIVFKHSPNGNWIMSLYNVTEDEWLHCGEFLKERYGGGGHKGAAGCTLSEEQFIKILKNKQI